MNNENEIFESFGISGSKKVAKGLLKNLSTIIAVIAMIVLITLVFADVSVNTTFGWRWAVKLVFYSLLMYVLFFSMQSTGQQDGRLQKIYTDLLSKYEGLRRQVQSDKDFESLQSWCDHYIEFELRQAKTRLLRSASIPYALFEEKYKDDQYPPPRSLPWKKRVAIRKARRMKPIHLTPDMLLSCGTLKVSRAPLGLAPGTKRMIRSIFNMLPRTILIFLVVDSTVSVISQPTIETFVSGIMMCFVGAMCAHQGYESGFKNIVEDTALYVERQINLLTQFVMWSGGEASSESSVPQIIRTDDPNTSVDNRVDN